VLLFLAEFLEARIIPQRIEHRIKPEQRGGQRQRALTQRMETPLARRMTDMIAKSTCLICGS
jgi:hypothetical protein